MFLDKITPVLEETSTKLYTMKWSPFFGEKNEQIIVDSHTPYFANSVLESADYFIGKITANTSLEDAATNVRDFSKLMAKTIPFLWFDSAKEFHKNDIWKKHSSIWPKYLETYDCGPRRLSDLEESGLTCVGQSLYLKQLLNENIFPGWNLYNYVVNGKRHVHGLLAKEHKEGYLIIDPSAYVGTTFAQTKEEFSEKHLLADIKEFNFN